MSENGSGNWRDTLFVWDGILTSEDVEKTKGGEGKDGDDDKKDSGTCEVTWEGTWVGVDEADATKAEAPKRGAFLEFVESDMQFQVAGKAKKDSSKGPFTIITIDDGGAGWDLGEGKDKKKHKDKTHQIILETLRWSGSADQTANLSFAKGTNDHGPFISVGWMRPGNRLTLARRYLDDNDARAKWDLEDLGKAVISEICGGDNKTTRIPPWQCSAMHVDDQTGKKRKVEKTDDGEKEQKTEAK